MVIWSLPVRDPLPVIEAPAVTPNRYAAAFRLTSKVLVTNILLCPAPEPSAPATAYRRWPCG